MEFRIAMLTLVPILFTLGLVFMVVYYRTQHPHGKMPESSQKASLF